MGFLGRHFVLNFVSFVLYFDTIILPLNPFFQKSFQTFQNSKKIYRNKPKTQKNKQDHYAHNPKIQKSLPFFFQNYFGQFDFGHLFVHFRFGQNSLELRKKSKLFCPGIEINNYNYFLLP